MITLDEKFKAKARAYAGSVDVKGICDNIYLHIRDKCRSMPIGEERNFIEAMLIKAIINHMLEAWSKGYEVANFNKDTITETLSEIRD